MFYFVGSNDGKENLKFGDYLRQRRKNRRKIDRDAFLPEQFEIKKRPVPWKAIGYAIGLFVVGTACLIAGCLIHTGHVDNEVQKIINIQCFLTKHRFHAKTINAIYTLCFRNLVIVFGL